MVILYKGVSVQKRMLSTQHKLSIMLCLMLCLCVENVCIYSVSSLFIPQICFCRGTQELVRDMCSKYAYKSEK